MDNTTSAWTIYIIKFVGGGGGGMVMFGKGELRNKGREGVEMG